LGVVRVFYVIDKDTSVSKKNGFSSTGDSNWVVLRIGEEGDEQKDRLLKETYAEIITFALSSEVIKKLKRSGGSHTGLSVRTRCEVR
jgi:hypothetical protein